MDKRDYIYKTLNSLIYGVAIAIYIMLFVYINNQWEVVPEEINYTWGIPEVDNIVANKWGLVILIGLMFLNIKRISKKQRKLEKKEKIVNAKIRWKRLTTALKTVFNSMFWGMVIIYIMQNASGKEIENGLNYIAIIIFLIISISITDKIVASILKRKRKIKV